MGVTYRLDRKRGVLLATAEGPIDLPEVRAHLLAEQKDSVLPYPELIDARKADPKLSPADVRQIVSFLQTLSSEAPLGKTAIVVSTDVAYGMMRMLSILVEDCCVVSPFRNLGDANKWLGL
jgi:hypothetical protein